MQVPLNNAASSVRFCKSLNERYCCSKIPVVSAQGNPLLADTKTY